MNSVQLLGHGQAKHKFLSEKLRTEIADGRYNTGSKLPGEHIMAKHFKVSRVTIRQAVGLLEKDGFVERKQGIGTFVKQLYEGRPIIKVRHLALILADISTKSDYALWGLTAAERWLVQQNVTISMASMESKKLIEGLCPPIFNSNALQGVVLDGKVQDFHCLVFEKRNIPYIVMGNHPISKDAPQIRSPFKRMAADAVRYLYNLKSQPVILMIEPFSLHYSKELFEGYKSAIQEMPQLPILETCENDNSYFGLKCLVKKGHEKFSILTTDLELPGILDVYREEGISAKDNPIVVIGSSQRIAARSRMQIHLMPIKADVVMIRAVQLLMEMITKSKKDVYEEIYFEIEPPVEQ